MLSAVCQQAAGWLQSAICEADWLVKWLPLDIVDSQRQRPLAKIPDNTPQGKGEGWKKGVASLSVVWLLVHLPATAIGNPNGNAFLHLVANA